MDDSINGAGAWLLLAHQLPAKPAYLRVRVWRRLQGLGAVPVKNAVHALPALDSTREDFMWLMREIQDGGGDAFLCEARLVSGLTDTDVRTLFDRARDEDYAAIAAEVRAALEMLRGNPDKIGDVRALSSRLRTQLAQVAAIDFFGAHGRTVTAGLLSELDTAMITVSGGGEPAKAATALTDLVGRTWVTRQGIQVDRIATAWLVRRFIDPNARLMFVPSKSTDLAPGVIRFDMMDGEVTHEGDKCSFEVLLGRAGLADPALSAIAEIVHDIDLKDAKFGRPEADGIRVLLSGICADTHDDGERLSRGMAVFDGLLAFFNRKGTPTP